MNIRIYTLTHKHFPVPPDPMYVPLQVGAAVHEDLGYLRDDEGENISDQNCYYSELTGFYWIWKNDHTSDYIGTCHYRRYLINDQKKVLAEWEYKKLLAEYDLITTKLEVLNNSYYYGFSANHNILALDATGEVIRERYPDYYDTFVELVNGPKTYYCNMLVTSRKLFGEYAEWLFTIFFEVQRRIDLDTDEDAYHKRVFGFISEFLLTVWVRVRKLRVCECMAGVLGEKAETAEVKERLAEYVRSADIDGAKEYFMEIHSRRPDIMMEAADITGELHLAMQIIATADAQRGRCGYSFLEQNAELKELYPLFSRLNGLVSVFAQGGEQPQDVSSLRKLFVQEEKADVPQPSARVPQKSENDFLPLPPEALKVATVICPNVQMDREDLYQKLSRYARMKKEGT